MFILESVIFGDCCASSIDLEVEGGIVLLCTGPLRNVLLGLQSIASDSLDSLALLREVLHVFTNSMASQALVVAECVPSPRRGLELAVGQLHSPQAMT